ncbi:DNA primase [Idiomarina abyssalis]|uniref:Toprim domain-containing protein n=1 Tax=Idiomarina abyssalis TaxID=86102 RepID=A0A8I1G9L3_9GAMM|nr:toprim domain-containing protein [Idiomarina abyssalis]MBJ7265490.1 toprim domain-containing protein [Idiomarina abyssalis]MBJ7316836.1 toprim domain-containing protein [Idiomarina abyssalis]
MPVSKQVVLQKAAQFYSESLAHSADAMSYLQARSLPLSVVDDMKIGYAPNEWDGFVSTLNAEEQAAALEIGLIAESNGRRYDSFRNRLIFPIRDEKGNVVGFGGRTLTDDTPKYLNSSESDVFKKSQILYGLDLAVKSGRKHLLVLEGYTDVCGLRAHDINTPVATLGTAFTEQHAHLLAKSNVKHVTFCFDGDKAGRDAAVRAMDAWAMLHEAGVEVGCVFLPDGLDPDEFVNSRGREKFSEYFQSNRLDAANSIAKLGVDRYLSYGKSPGLDAQLNCVAYINDLCMTADVSVERVRAAFDANPAFDCVQHSLLSQIDEFRQPPLENNNSKGFSP